MSATQKRGRACEACSKIKIRCSLGQASDEAAPPCERCVRLNKECVLTQPKRQKDRVAELEAQVEALTRLLASQNIQIPQESPTSQAASVSSEPAPIATTKKRRLEQTPDTSGVSTSSPESHDADLSDIQKLDRTLSYELQERTLSRYQTVILPLFPMVHLQSDCTLPSLRSNRSVLLLACLYAASPGFLSLDAQEDIARLLLDGLSSRAIAHGEETLELIQAIQITCLWYRAPKHHRRAAVYQLIDLASALASDLNAGGPLAPPVKGLSLDAGTYESVVGWRAWLGCHILSASMSIFMRKPVTVTWTDNHEQARLMLQYSPVNESTDRWLAQYFRAERLCEEVAEQMEFSNLSVCHDVSEPEIKNKVQSCRNKILNWKMAIPLELRSPMLLFWEHIATAYMHETVLHTSTNKESFAAPYLAERLSLTDFPIPVITQDHITAVYELTAAVHAIMEIYTSLDTSTLIASPSLVYAARAAYALFVLAKLHIAVTAPGNTLGSVIDSSILALPEYADKFSVCGVRVRAVDERCGPARIMQTGPAMKDWYNNYHQFLLSNPGYTQSNQMLGYDQTTALSGAPTLQQDATDLPQAMPTDWETLLLYGDSNADYGFDQLFAESMPLAASHTDMYSLT